MALSLGTQRLAQGMALGATVAIVSMTILLGFLTVRPPRVRALECLQVQLDDPAPARWLSSAYWSEGERTRPALYCAERRSTP